MHDDKFVETILAILSICFILFIVYFTFHITSKLQNLRQEAISLHYAEYNSTNGVWQWKANKQ